MADNDLRGFPDGGFRYGWNQPTQMHVRLGRRANPDPTYGEHELFRALHRWGGIALPDAAQVVGCRLSLSVEDGPESRVRLFLYPMRRDWNPGAGGELRNNISVPEPGEVWWVDARFNEEAWGLPGAGYFSDEDGQADVAAMPLADETWEPGQDTVAFVSDPLTEYVGSRLAVGDPLLWMIKLADEQESEPGSVLTLFSAEYGDSVCPLQRPCLEIDWRWPSELLSTEIDVRLERGRVQELRRHDAEGGPWMASFWPTEGGSSPRIEVREGKRGEPGPWRGLAGPYALDPASEWIQLRLLAMERPLRLGEDFEAELANTWVLTGPPELQRVLWTFESPSGLVHEVEGTHEGGFRWSVRFRPDEPGTWSYRWTESFATDPHDGPRASFDVWADDLEPVLEHLDALRSDLEAGTLEPERARRRLYLLEAAGVRLLDPSAHRGAPGGRLRERVRLVRELLADGPVPEVFPMESHELLEESNGHRFSSPIPRVGRLGHRLTGGHPSAGSGPDPSLLGRLRRLARRLRRRLSG